MVQASEKLAATVVLLRDSADGPEVLLLERPHDRGSFAGAWVFPGGAVDPEDGAHDGREGSALIRAAVRETVEETGLVIEPAALAEFATWHPPLEAQKRMTTTFYCARAPEGAVTIDERESVAYAWMTPAKALESHAAGGFVLFPPTWVTLHGFVGAASAAEAIERVRRAGPEVFATRFRGEGAFVTWQGDVAYDDDAALDAAGGRHRLDVRTLPWNYERTVGPHG